LNCGCLPGRLLDGRWDFKLLDSVIGRLLYDEAMPDIVVVGIAYSGEHPDYNGLRGIDYTPVPGDAKRSGEGPNTFRHANVCWLAFKWRRLMGLDARVIAIGPFARNVLPEMVFSIAEHFNVDPRGKKDKVKTNS
jgi:hypothetical protein